MSCTKNVDDSWVPATLASASTWQGSHCGSSSGGKTQKLTLFAALVDLELTSAERCGEGEKGEERERKEEESTGGGAGGKGARAGAKREICQK